MGSKPKNPNWKPELTFALSKGLSFISACSYAQVNVKTAYNHGFRPNKIDMMSDHHETIVEMRKRGKSLAEISKAIGFCISGISSYCVEQGIKKPKKLDIKY